MDINSAHTTTLTTWSRIFASRGSFLHRASKVKDDGLDDTKGRLGLSLLYSPSEPLLDFIFVHGLGGGSRKTWSKTNSVAHYWPQEWLPRDPAFKDVRVHSFGYNSDWVKGNDNILNIHHFGKSLLGEMSTSPYLGDKNTPIVLIGHSMGGLVIKKAYILASLDEMYEPLRKRIHTIFFLATPHRGSNMAKLLNNILEIAYSSPAYVAELEQNSAALKSINDEFPKYSDDINIWSFYETKKLSRGPFSSLIVDPNSATLGYRKEKQMPMNADHRSICKFESPTDPNYLLLRNAIASTVNIISSIVLKSKEKSWRSRIKDLENYLGVSQNQEDDLITIKQARIPGTCEWFSKEKSYLNWRDFGSEAPSILWANGNPAAGKTVLAGYVIDQLQNTNAGCSYFLFKHGDKSKTRLSYCIRSLAFQMACTNSLIRETLLGMQKDEIKLENDNEHLLWQTKFNILGLDRFQTLNISSTTILPDIKLLVEAKTKLLVKNEEDRATLVGNIVEKSQGNFLWTVLVLNEMLKSHSEEEINQILGDIPRDMEPFYRRTLEFMPRANGLTEAILIWATCAMRPITMNELQVALKIEMKDNFFRLEETIQDLCGQLVTVDKFGKMQMIHETAREFLLKHELQSQFSISVTEAHTRIASACLRYLTSEEMKPRRIGRRSSAKISPRKMVQFSLYACTAFSYHLTLADPLSRDVLSLVNTFLKSNILSWVETIAQTKHLTPLISTADNLRKYADSILLERPALVKEIQIIRGWTIDLIHIVMRFTDALIVSPSAIYTLILPFCPTETTAYKAVGRGRRLSILGISNTQWNVQLSCIDFHQLQTCTVCYGEKFFAVGLNTGIFELYYATTCQKYMVLDHGENLKFLSFQNKTNLMASCGMKTIRIWDICSGETTHIFEAPQQSKSLVFEANLLIVASANSYLASWDLHDNGARQPDRSWRISGEDTNKVQRRLATSISISLSHKMLAVAYTWKPVVLWDLEQDMYYGSCGKKLENGNTSTHPITALLFNPNPAIELLVISYLDGLLVLLDPFNDQELMSFRANCHVLAASPDGRLLAGSTSSTIKIYKFDTLTLLYRVKSSNIFIRQLAFSKDSLQLADIRGTQCNVWQPAALLQGMVREEDNKETSDSFIEAVTTDPKAIITAMILNSDGEVVFCGKEDGSISLYDLRTGTYTRTLYSHKSPVRLLTWWPQRDIIMSIDCSNNIWGWNLRKSEQERMLEKMLFQSRLDCERSIFQILPGDVVGKFIVSTRKSDYLWNINGQQEKEKIHSEPGIRRWIQHPQSSLHMICIDGGKASIYTWADWSQIREVHLAIPIVGMEIKSANIYISGHIPRILLELSGQRGIVSMHLLDAIALRLQDDNQKNENISKGADRGTSNSELMEEEATSPAVSSPLFPRELNAFANHVIHIIGISSTSRLIFLDTHSWVCSADLESFSNGGPSYLRHFFVPWDWHSGTHDMICAVSKTGVVIARNDEVAVIKDGLEFIEKVDVEPIDTEIEEGSRSYTAI
ncbi:hypothetical protein B7463_g1349, partial [Scytalidium lignicola]